MPLKILSGMACPMIHRHRKGVARKLFASKLFHCKVPDLLRHLMNMTFQVLYRRHFCISIQNLHHVTEIVVFNNVVDSKIFGGTRSSQLPFKVILGLVFGHLHLLCTWKWNLVLNLDVSKDSYQCHRQLPLILVLLVVSRRRRLGSDYKGMLVVELATTCWQ